MYKIFLLFLLTPIILFSQTTENQDFWEPFHYFIGSWEGKNTGKAGVGKGDRVYEFIMNGKYLYVKNKAVFDPQEKNPTGEVHEDWSFFSYDRNHKKFVMRQFNSEGFVNQFVLDSLSTNGKIFVFNTESSENSPPGLRARITLLIKNSDEFIEKFELAPPGKDFIICIENIWNRRE